VPMQRYDRRVGHLHGGVVSASRCVHYLGPYACPVPANKAVVAAGIHRSWWAAPECKQSSVIAGPMMRAIVDSRRADPLGITPCVKLYAV
jgi:hypothetical protein